MNSGSLPSISKEAIIVPIFKKVDKSQQPNYRRISITCNIYLVFEGIISDQLIFYLNSNDLISKNQFGFLKNKSTELQLFKSHAFWCSEQIKGNYLDIIYFDCDKAFDNVSHEKLLLKLRSYGIKIIWNSY